ncbi:hypothetical protein CANARDRAFT_27413 [[Candida] arabinofermentans NRRL YB-2248]|uniref:LYC1 C-terminal domain-containing protein n=1 Tax=[Candida] arabinofermentans NRRL YB-2248 TaxID=983967 RepID=A0A1E4T320_9ASCO|nr:hypothetical protein CANARDRAFT_27413 [[Candida] arabinofermentans NRRL YB-2248]
MVEKSSNAKCCILPSVANIEWFQNRSIHTTTSLNITIPKTYGLKIGDSFILWFYDLRLKKLQVLMISYNTVFELSNLLDALIDFIRLKLMKGDDDDFIDKIGIWNNDLYQLNDENPETIKSFLLTKTKKLNEVNESLGMLRVNGYEARGSVEWIGNGKWAWY